MIPPLDVFRNRVLANVFRVFEQVRQDLEEERQVRLLERKLARRKRFRELQKLLRSNAQPR